MKDDDTAAAQVVPGRATEVVPSRAVSSHRGGSETRIATGPGLASVVLLLEQVLPTERSSARLLAVRQVSVRRAFELVAAPAVLLARVVSRQKTWARVSVLEKVVPAHGRNRGEQSRLWLAVIPDVAVLASRRGWSVWTPDELELPRGVDEVIWSPAGRWWLAAWLRKEVVALPQNKKLQLTSALPRCARAGACT
jgi:hypothetical protein